MHWLSDAWYIHHVNKNREQSNLKERMMKEGWAGGNGVAMDID
jgi:hypothetical protein